ncbi:MAG TPA: hypothetical protein VM096_14965 [Vicinamibacterales bacterium]|nr:hypothetical protein [Vicinamibacterales bacterium]
MALRNHRLAALALFIGMAVLHSWPLASDLSHLSRLDNHDAELNTWIIAWVAHALPRQPLRMFEAPILYPERHSLAFSEHMFVPSVMGAPLLWSGVSPVTVYNVLIIAGFALSGWSMYLLMRRWTGSEPAAIVAGLIYAFNAHSLTRFVHLQAQHVEFFPLMLYALDRVIADPSTPLQGGGWRRAALLATALVLQSLCSNYLLVFSTYAILIAVAVRWKEINTMNKRVELIIAGLIAAVLLAPFLWPYYQVNREYGLARSADVVTQYNAGWRDYLVTGGRMHYAWWSHIFYEGRTALFPGFVALTLALFAVYVDKRGSTPKFNISDVEIRGLSPKINMVVAIGVLGMAMSLGTSLPGYGLLHEWLPLLSGLRNVARWGWLPLAAIAVLAGFGVASLKRRAGDWVAIAIALLVTIEAIRTPVGYTRFNGIPAIYDRLASQSNAVVAEFPFYSGPNVSLNGPYVLANTRYFKPLLNGYSSFHPESFEQRGRILNSFPSESAIAELRTAHVTHVLVHAQAFERRYGRKALDAIDMLAELQLEAADDGVTLYRLK